MPSTSDQLALTLLTSGVLDVEQASALLARYGDVLADTRRLGELSVPPEALVGWITGAKVATARARAALLSPTQSELVAGHERRVTVVRLLVDNAKTTRWDPAVCANVAEVAAAADDGLLGREVAGELDEADLARLAEQLAPLGHPASIVTVARRGPGALTDALAAMSASNNGPSLDVDEVTRRGHGLAQALEEVVAAGDGAALASFGFCAVQVYGLLGLSGRRRCDPATLETLFCAAGEPDLDMTLRADVPSAASACARLAAGAEGATVTPAVRFRPDFAWLLAHAAISPANADKMLLTLARYPITGEVADAMVELHKDGTWPDEVESWNITDVDAAKRLLAGGLTEAAASTVERGLLSVAETIMATPADAFDDVVGLLGHLEGDELAAAVDAVLATGRCPAALADTIHVSDWTPALRAALEQVVRDGRPDVFAIGESGIIALLDDAEMRRLIAKDPELAVGSVAVELLAYDDVERAPLLARLGAHQVGAWFNLRRSQRPGDVEQLDRDAATGAVARHFWASGYGPLPDVVEQVLTTMPAADAVRLPAGAKMLTDAAALHGPEVLETALALDWHGDFGSMLQACCELVASAPAR